MLTQPKKFLLPVMSAISILSSFSALGFEEGKHFKTLDHAHTQTPTVNIFQSIYCKPCAIVHGPLIKAANQSGAEFQEVPVPYGALYKDIQRGFVLAHQEGKSQQYIGKLITRVHHKRNAAPQNVKDIISVLEECGVNGEPLLSDCQALDNGIEEMDELVRKYRIRATPTIIVNGNKEVVLHSLKSISELHELIDYLVKTEA